MKNLTIFLFLISVAGLALAHEDLTAGATIHMENDSYKPKEVTILQGQRVIFENVSKEDRWPASDIHPTHTAYPGSDIELCGKDENIFDACGAIEPGESYEYVFTKVGNWRCHDHIKPTLGCTIKVETNPDFKEQITFKNRISIFQKSINRSFLKIKSKTLGLVYKILPFLKPEIKIFEIAENSNELHQWLQILGPEEVMTSLVTESGGGGEIDCHTQAHLIGRAAYELFGAEVFEKGTADCHSGFYHGAMESLLATEGTENLAETVSELCANFPSSFGNFECLHGVGHGVMAYVQYDLIEAIEQCGQLSSSFEQSSCYGGVFMENVVAGQGNGAIPGHETTWVSKDMHFPCKEFTNNYLAATECYKMQTSWMLTLANYDFEIVASECLNSLPDQINNCYLSFGRDSAGFNLRQPQAILNNCQLVIDTSPDHYQTCLSGSLNVIIDFWGENLESQAAEFCSQVPSQNQAGCYTELASRLSGVFINKNELKIRCEEIPSAYRVNCQAT